MKNVNINMIKNEIEYLCNMFDEDGDFFSDDFKKELLNDITKSLGNDDILSIIADIDCGRTIDVAIQNSFICNSKEAN